MSELRALAVRAGASRSEQLDAVTPTEAKQVPDDTKIPGIADLLWPALKAVSDLGGSARRNEIVDQARGIAQITDEQLAPLSQDGNPKVLHRTIWAVHQLKAIGALEGSRRGVYATTQDGAGYLEMGDIAADAALRAAYDDHLRRTGKKSAATKKPSAVNEETVAPNDTPGEHVEGEDEIGTVRASDGGWRIKLLETLKKMPPTAFEHLVKRILREAGFQKVDVVGRVGDGGIDGVGLYRMSLVSFPIYFQCKRYAGSVGPGVVRDFRGAMAGRGDKGLLITTGTFTVAAQAEATKAGTPPIDLIDGDRLCGLILKYRVGVEVRTVEVVTIDQAYFANV